MNRTIERLYPPNDLDTAAGMRAAVMPLLYSALRKWTFPLPNGPAIVSTWNCRNGMVKVRLAPTLVIKGA